MNLIKILLFSLIWISPLTQAQELAESAASVENIVSSSSTIKCKTTVNSQTVQDGKVELIPQLGDENGAELGILHQNENLEINVFTNPLEIMIGEIQNGAIKKLHENSLLDQLQQYVLSGGGKSVRIRRVVADQLINVRCILLQK